jgi:hypothetical protein
MKKTILLFALALITFCSCRKTQEETNVTEGFLIGFRGETCACCTGNLIKIGRDTLQFEKFPDNSPKVALVYPHKVNLLWQRDTSACIRLNDKLIIVSKIEFL